jgi:hypothetical protein
MAASRRIDPKLDPKRTTQLLETLEDAARANRMLKARLVKAQNAETGTTPRKPHRRRGPTE